MFRPEVTVEAPDGSSWEIYVSRVRRPQWRPWTYEDLDLPVNSLPSLVVGSLQFVIFDVVLPAISFVLRLPFAVLRSRRSRTWVVEAVSWWPHEQRFQWWVDAADRERVRDEVAKGIAEGRWAQPAGAVFNGQVTG